jgi:hypothetical protein
MANRVSDFLRHSIVNRRALARGGATGAALAVLGMAGARRAAAQDEQSAGAEGGAGRIAVEYVGTVHQRGFDLTFYGFVTHVSGVDGALLFATDDPLNRVAETARITMHATATGTSRTIHQPLFMVDGEGGGSFFFSEGGGASFEDPDSFAAGAKVSSFSTRIQNVIHVIAPDTGIATANGDLTFTEVSTVVAGNASLAVGRADVAATLSFTGHGTLLDPALPESLIAIAGNLRF